MNEKFSYVIARELYEFGGELERIIYYNEEVIYGDIEHAKAILSTVGPDFKIYKLVELDTDQNL